MFSVAFSMQKSIFSLFALWLSPNLSSAYFPSFIFSALEVDVWEACNLPQASVITQHRHTNSRMERKRGNGSTHNKSLETKRTESEENINKGNSVFFHLMSTWGKAQAKLTTDHHGLIQAPVFTADRAPAFHSSDFHQHLHTALRWFSASCQTHLKVKGARKCFLLYA